MPEDGFNKVERMVSKAVHVIDNVVSVLKVTARDVIRELVQFIWEVDRTMIWGLDILWEDIIEKVDIAARGVWLWITHCLGVGEQEV